MNVLVLGGNGFIGSHLVDALLLAGHQVRVLDRRSELHRPPLPQVEYRLGNWADTPFLCDALEGIEFVYHLVSTTLPSTSNLDPIADIEGNLVNTLKLLQLMVQKGVVRILFLSSGGTVYGIPSRSPIPETHALQPICSYGVVKVAIEQYLFMFQALHGLKPIIIRASNPYGERQGHDGVQGVINTVLKKIILGENIDIWGDGSVVRDFIHISDLVDLCIKASVRDCVGVLNAGSGIGCSIDQVLRVVMDATQRRITAVFLQGRAYDVPSVVLDISKAADTLGWHPRVSLSDGVAQTWRWMQASTR